MSARILIIDDEPRWIEFTTKLGNGFKIEVAQDLKTALSKLDRNAYDLVIASARCTDILTAINKRHPETRIAIATGQPTTREAITMYRLGVYDYFAKDFRQEVVSERIQEAVAKPAPA